MVDQGLTTRELQKLLLTGHAISQEPDEEGICRWICDAATSLLDASLASIALTPTDHTGPGPVFGRIGDSPMPKQLAKTLARVGEKEWPPAHRSGRVATLASGDLPSGLTRRGINRLLGIRVGTLQRELGFLTVGKEGPPELGSQEEFVLATLANQATVALENTRLRRQTIKQTQTLEALIQASPLAIIARDRNSNVCLWNRAAETMFGWTAGEIIDRPYPLVPDEKLTEYRGNIELALRGEALTNLETRRKKKDGAPVDVSVWTAPLSDGGAMVVIDDITERKRAEEALADLASFAEMNPAARQLFGEPYLLGKSWYTLCPESEPIVLERVLQSNDTLQCETEVGERCLLFTHRASLDRGQVYVYGADITARKQVQETLLQQMRELAVMEERNRLAREIHDSLAQGITGIIWQLNALEQAVQNGGPQPLDALNRVRDVAKECLQEARRSVWDLRQSPLQGSSLVDALRNETSKASTGEQLLASLKVSGQERVLPSGVEAAILRLCQESLANVMKHADATQVTVSLIYDDAEVRLAVQDNGKGFETEAPRSPSAEGGGFGIAGMRERTRILGGDLAVHSHPNGTLVEANLPLSKESWPSKT